jgi:hypothetical protein
MAGYKSESIPFVKNGLAGYNGATVVLYKRSPSMPSAMPTGPLTYTFANGVLSGTKSYFNGWSNEIPSGED